MLNTQPNLDAPDAFYAALTGLHRGLAMEESRQLNSRLILLLANHIGDERVLRQAMDRAAAGLRRSTP